jgi:hypothetical protein
MKVNIEDDAVLTYIDGLSAEFYSIVYKLLELMLEADPKLNIGFQSKRITITKEENWKKWIFGISAMSKVINLEIRVGEKIEDPKGILQGTPQKPLRFIHFKELKEITKIQPALVEIFKKGIAIYGQ